MSGARHPVTTAGKPLLRDADIRQSGLLTDDRPRGHDVKMLGRSARTAAPKPSIRIPVLETAKRKFHREPHAAISSPSKPQPGAILAHAGT